VQDDANAESVTGDAQAAAHTLGHKLVVLNASTENEIDAAFATLVQQRVGALVVMHRRGGCAACENFRPVGKHRCHFKHTLAVQGDVSIVHLKSRTPRSLLRVMNRPLGLLSLWSASLQ
jgi:hypothetical protein